MQTDGQSLPRSSRGLKLKRPKRLGEQASADRVSSRAKVRQNRTSAERKRTHSIPGLESAVSVFAPEGHGKEYRIGFPKPGPSPGKVIYFHTPSRRLFGLKTTEF